MFTSGKASDIDFFIQYFYTHFELANNKSEVVEVWLDEFDASIENWDFQSSAKLLAAIKKLSLSPYQTALAYMATGEIQTQQGNFEDSNRSYTRALQVADSPKQQETKFRILNRFAASLAAQQKYEEAEKYYQDAISLATNLNRSYLIAQSFFNLAILFDEQGKWKDAIQTYKNSLAKLNSKTDKDNIARAYNNLGILYEKQGDLHEAEKYFYQCLDLLDELGLAYSDSGIRMLENIGQIEAKKGDWEKAIGCYDAALNICQEIDATYHEATTLNNLGTIYLEQGDLPNAISSFTKSAEKHQSVNNPKGQSLALSNLGSAYVDQGAYDLADQCYQNSLLISKSFGDRSREARTYNNLGALAEKTARYKEALAHYEKSMLVFIELEEFYRAIVAIINICSLHNRLSSPHKCMHFLEQGLELAKKEEYYDHAFTLSIIRGDALFIQGSEFYPLAFEWYGQASRYASMLPFISLETFIKTIQARIAYLESAKEANNDLELLLGILVKTWGDSTLSKRELDFFEYLSQKALPPTPN